MEMNIKTLVAKAGNLAKIKEPIIVKNRNREMGLFVPFNEEVKKSFPSLYREAQIAKAVLSIEESEAPAEEIISRLRRRLKNGGKSGEGQSQ